MEVLDLDMNMKIFASKMDNLEMGDNNDYRQDLLTWLNERMLDKGSFMKMYPKEKTVGKGAFSTIYKSGNKTVRISGKKPELFLPLVMELNRFRNETEIMEKLQGSEYIVKLYDTFVVGAAVCHIMEYADGRSLEKYIPVKGMYVNDALACMYQLFKGLEFMHGNGIIHGDIKPANVLVFSNGQLKITDFDVSLRKQGGSIIDVDGDVLDKYIFMGSPSYMAPEVAGQVELKNIDDMFKIDVFSAGRTFLELLTKMDDIIKLPPLKVIRQTLQESSIDNALNIERNVKGRSCKRCANMFLYTLQYNPEYRKTAGWILERMRNWTWRPGRYGFDEEKSVRIVKDMMAGPSELVGNLNVKFRF